MDIELRLHIYRYVLIPGIPLHLEEPPPPPTPRDSESNHENGQGDEDEWIDESDSDSNNHIPSDLLDAFRNADGDFEYNGMDLDELEEAYYAEELDPETEQIFQAMERQQMIDDSISDYSDSDLDGEHPQQRSGRELAILRTNRQVYHEASALFYSEATVIISLDDLIDLAKQRPPNVLGRWQFVWMDTWKYHPILNPGKQIPDGSFVYESNPTSKEIKMSRDRRHDCKTHDTEPSLSKCKGKLYPHLFARFQNIKLDTIFEDEYIQQDTVWIDDETFIIRQSDADKIIKHVGSFRSDTSQYMKQ